MRLRPEEEPECEVDICSSENHRPETKVDTVSEDEARVACSDRVEPQPEPSRDSSSSVCPTIRPAQRSIKFDASLEPSDAPAEGRSEVLESAFPRKAKKMRKEYSEENRLNKKEWFVQNCPRDIAACLICKLHYAHSTGGIGAFIHGLFKHGDPEPKGIVWWNPAIITVGKNVDPDDCQGVICLSRMVVAPDVPKNACSFMLSRSLKIIRNSRNWHMAVTYADTRQGHLGGVYKSSGWLFCTTTRGGRMYEDSEGAQKTHRMKGKTFSIAEMQAMGYTFKGYTRKRKYIIQVLPRGTQRIRQVNLFTRMPE